MDRLAEQVVAWHNRNPLAKRISIFDVHTIGVVALPFMRSGGPAQEPGLDTRTPALDANALDDLPGTDAMVAAAEEVAAAAAPQAAANRRQKLSGLGAGLLAALSAGLLRWRRLLPRRDQSWALFSERFISRLSRRAIVNFALKHGYGTAPGSADWPMRTVAVDERLMHEGSGAWPYEIYLISAGIDAGSSRTRVLMARHPGQPLAVLGRRCLNPLAVAGALALPAALLASLSVLMWPGAGTDTHGPASAASAASAAVAASAPAAMPASTPASAATVAAPAASLPVAVQAGASAAASAATPARAGSAAASATPLSLATAPALAASEVASAPAAAPVSSLPSSSAAPDIRPRLVVPARRARASEPAGTPPPVAAASSPAAPKAAAPKAAAPPSGTASPAMEPKATSGTRPAASTATLDDDGRLPSVSAPAPGARQVALVGPVFAKREEAQAMLVRMNRQLSQTVRDPGRLQAQLFQTPEGWRPAIFPFGSREEAQLINATLIASGLRTRAVDF